VIERRLNRGWSPNDLAREAGIAGNTVRAAERGEYVSPRTQYAIACALDAELLELFPLERQRFAT
jgi:transcriptional regulator with XRE-family HTH domain